MGWPTWRMILGLHALVWKLQQVDPELWGISYNGIIYS